MSEFLKAMSSLSSAEEFLDALGVDYDPTVVSVNRLHILKRFHDYIRREDFEGAGDKVMRDRYKALLEQAYGDFLASDGVTEKVFKVFQQQKPGFVSLGSIRRG